MKSLCKLSFIFSFLLGMFTFSSCVSTETMEPEMENDQNRIVLNLDSPTPDGTRADSNHKLRYVAKLFMGYKNNLSTDIYYRKEIIEGDASQGDKANQIIFDVPKGTYTIIVFADYIPVDRQKNNQGEYGDYYYDTSKKDVVTVLPTPGDKNSEKPSASFFNNDNYDCFMGLVTIEKTEKKEICNMALQRIVSKVRFLDTSNNAGQYNIKLSKAGCYSMYDINSDIANFLENYSANITLTKQMNGSTDQEILFYYTFATKDKPTKEKLNVSFSVSNNSGQNNEFSISNIEINQNYITTVRGKFLPTSPGSTPGNPNNPSDPGTGENPGTDNPDNPNNPNNPDNPNTPGGSDNPNEEGPIYLNLSISSDPWLNSTSEWN